MCYGTCNFEGYMGECDSMLLSLKEEIKAKTGFTPCFIGGGSICCPEEDDYWNELNKEGKIQEFKTIVNNVIRKRREEIESIWKSKLLIKG